MPTPTPVQPRRAGSAPRRSPAPSAGLTRPHLATIELTLRSQRIARVRLSRTHLGQRDRQAVAPTPQLRMQAPVRCTSLQPPVQANRFPQQVDREKARSRLSQVSTRVLAVLQRSPGALFSSEPMYSSLQRRLHRDESAGAAPTRARQRFNLALTPLGMPMRRNPPGWIPVLHWFRLPKNTGSE